jgi:hypothetical protein
MKNLLLLLPILVFSPSVNNLTNQMVINLAQLRNISVEQ